jgi:nitric oxide synthase-interacting protein
MPSRHSKNNSTRGFFTRAEKEMAGHGTQTARVGRDSQLPFGYCCLSLQPALDAVVSPSGHIYSREAVLEYILQKTKELKASAQDFEDQEAGHAARKEADESKRVEQSVARFAEGQDGVSLLAKRKISDSEASSTHLAQRHKVIDDTSDQVRCTYYFDSDIILFIGVNSLIYLHVVAMILL